MRFVRELCAALISRLALFVPVVIATIIAVFTLPATSQNLLVHHSLYFEDGDKKLDGDGDTNKIVVWRGGATHICVGKIYVDSGYTLIIQAGAIVKFADEFNTDTSGKLISWKAPSDAGFASDGPMTMPGGVIQITGATLTDIRDDAVGGDDNADGSATTPTSPRSSLNIRFSGGPQDILVGNTLKYFAKIGHLGSMRITGNNFVEFGNISSNSGYPTGMDPVMPNSSPIISGNTFAFASYGGMVDVRGLSATVANNHFTGVANSSCLYIGLAHATSAFADHGEVLPRGGTTFVQDNFIETKNGIEVSPYDSDSLFMKKTFTAEITGNRFHSADGNGNTAIALTIDALATVSNNTVENFTSPIGFRIDRGPFGGQTVGLHVNNNRFEFVQSTSTLTMADTFWHRGVYVDMKNNYWGDPTGPNDYSNADKFYNPRGKGFHLSDGIEYVPFTGGATASDRDAITITATAQPDPLVPTNTAFITVKVTTLSFFSTPHGKIVVTVRDGEGFILNTPPTIVTIDSQQTAVDIPQISVSVPELTHAITVEADIVPSDDLTPTTSNVVSIPVPQPADAFSISGVYDEATRYPLLPFLVPGTLTNARVEFNYTHIGSPLEFNVTINDVDASGFEIDQRDAHNTQFSEPEGVNLNDWRDILVSIPLRDVTTYPKRKLWGKFEVTDGAGKSLGHLADVLTISVDANNMRFGNVTLWDINGSSTPVKRGRSFFVEGDKLDMAVQAMWNIATPDIKSWRLVVGPYRAFDNSGKLLHEWAPSAPVKSDVASGSHPKPYEVLVNADPTWPLVPGNAQTMRLYMHIETPEGIIVAIDSVNIPVHLQPIQTMQQVLDAGSPKVNFAPLPVKLDVTSNPTKVGATALQFSGPFQSVHTISGPSIASVPSHWQFTPLNRWYAVFDTMPQNSITATLTIGYDPATDFPAGGVNEDSLVLCGYNYYSRALEALPTVVNKVDHTVSADFTTFFDTYVIASRATHIDAVAPSKVSTPDVCSIASVYPNPSHDASMISLSTSHDIKAKLEVYDALGRRVAVLLDGVVPSGERYVSWNTERMPAGCYRLRLTGDRVVAEKTVMILH